MSRHPCRRGGWHRPARRDRSNDTTVPHCERWRRFVKRTVAARPPSRPTIPMPPAGSPPCRSGSAASTATSSSGSPGGRPGPSSTARSAASRSSSRPPEPEPGRRDRSAERARPPGKLFEQDDFDVLPGRDATFRTPDAAPAEAIEVRPPPGAGPLPPRPFAVEQSLPGPPADAPPPPAGTAGWSFRPGADPALIAVLVLIGLAFGGGILVGRMTIVPG